MRWRHKSRHVSRHFKSKIRNYVTLLNIVMAFIHGFIHAELKCFSLQISHNESYHVKENRSLCLFSPIGAIPGQMKTKIEQTTQI